MAGDLQSLLVTVLEVASMLAAGASLVPEELVRSLRRGRLLLFTLFVNFVLVPGVGYALSSGLGAHEKPLSLAVLITAASPGGGTGPLLALIAGADVALSVVVTFVLALVSCVVTPLVLHAGASHDAALLSGLPLGQLLRAIALYQFVPLALGAWLHVRNPGLSARLAKLASRVALVVLAVLAVGLIHRLRDVFGTTTLLGWTALAGVVVAGLGAYALVPDAPSRVRSLALTTGIRNCALSLVIASHWGAGEAMAAVLQFAFVMYALCFAYAAWARRHPVPVAQGQQPTEVA